MNAFLRELVRFRPPVMTPSESLRLVGPTVVILTGFALAGHYVLGLLIGLGTYGVLFGAVPSRQRRAMVVAIAGVGLLAAVLLGILCAGSLWRVLAAYIVVTLTAAIVDEVLPLGPPGPAFFVLMVGAGQTIGAAGVPADKVIGPLALGGRSPGSLPCWERTARTSRRQLRPRRGNRPCHAGFDSDSAGRRRTR